MRGSGSYRSKPGKDNRAQVRLPDAENPFRAHLQRVRNRPRSFRRHPQGGRTPGSRESLFPIQVDAPAIAALAKRLREIVAPFSGKGKIGICVSRRDGSEGGALGRDFVNMEDCEKRMREMGCRQIEISRLDPDAQFTQVRQLKS